MKIKKCIFTERTAAKLFLLVLAAFSMASNIVADSSKMSKKEQLKDLRSKQTLVPTWGWPVEEMAEAAKDFGYELINVHLPATKESKVEEQKKKNRFEEESSIWERNGIQVLDRPQIETYDPFDSRDVERGIEKLIDVINIHKGNSNILGFAITWGMFGEGGFPVNYEFTDIAKEKFNKYMNTPGEPLPEPPTLGVPGSKRWLKWNEFRMRTLRNFRRDYVYAAKQHTDKLVGTWSEIYPTSNYFLNMGVAPGADFLFHDLSFGHVTADQTIALGECGNEMWRYSTFEEWRKHELPLMAKSAGEGVIPVGFQFPMREGHALNPDESIQVVDDGGNYTVSKIEDEYALRIGKDIRELIDTVDGRTRDPEVALVYNSFASAGLPGGHNDPNSQVATVHPFYENTCAKQIEGLMHQMGIDMKVLPYESLENKDLSKYKLVIIPDPVYLNDSMKTNLSDAPKVLYAGEYLLSHRDPSTESGNYTDSDGFSATTHLNHRDIDYFKASSGALTSDSPNHRWLDGLSLPSSRDYPEDQMSRFDPMIAGAKIVLKVGSNPLIIEDTGSNRIFVTNRFFHNGWDLASDWLEAIQFTFLKNLLVDCGVKIRITSDSQCRVKEKPIYGSYGLSGYVAWNAIAEDITVTLNNGSQITIPGYGWTFVEP